MLQRRLDSAAVPPAAHPCHPLSCFQPPAEPPAAPPCSALLPSSALLHLYAQHIAAPPCSVTCVGCLLLPALLGHSRRLLGPLSLSTRCSAWRPAAAATASARGTGLKKFKIERQPSPLAVRGNCGFRGCSGRGNARSSRIILAERILAEAPLAPMAAPRRGATRQAQ